MANNLLKLRQARALTQDDAALAMGTTRSQYVKLENGARRLSEKWIDRAAMAFGVDPAEVVRSSSCARTIMGTIDGEGVVTFAEGYSFSSVDPIALRLKDGSIFDGWLAIIGSGQARDAGCPSVENVFMIMLEDQRIVLGRISATKSSRRLSHVHLRSGTVWPDQVIAGVRPITYVSLVATG